MAPSTSSVFDEAPSADAAPAAAPVPVPVPAASAAPDASVMVAKASTTSSASSAGAEAQSGATATAPAVASTSATQTKQTSGASERLQAAKKTECASAREEKQAKTQATDSVSGTRYARVSPAVLESVKASLSFRKSCLKRSKSSALSPTRFAEEGVALAAARVECSEVEVPARPVQKNRRRCWECKAKVGLTAVRCRCDYTFCGKHRYAEEHQCAFNFKTAGKRKLAAENPVVVPRKVARIN